MHSPFCKFHTNLNKIRQLNIPEALGIMPPPEMGVLGEIKSLKAEKPDSSVNVSHISQALHVSASAVSRTLKRLEEKGLIDREVDRDDRRNVCVVITALGQKELEESQRRMAEFLQEVFAGLGEEKTELFSQIMEELYQSFYRQAQLIDKKKKDEGQNK
ncbi:MAG: MarR family transcriptional regulator [Clostridiales bacterium]|nr:MarR family transcriptional regulator [Clostridiales bacterium]